MTADVNRLREMMADALLVIVLRALKDEGQLTLPENGREAQAIRDILYFYLR